ncbi:hypothetical protein T05_12461 [Trichinella murrelli]|uniref:Uncharacterized protein n=1 Tax=Trichinella murrelli TaxID=144512 RepID=A0A0V0TCW6_9BILA|nr:hypothetical protein T05_12461 [Trichinella murrelli]
MRINSIRSSPTAKKKDDYPAPLLVWQKHPKRVDQTVLPSHVKLVRSQDIINNRYLIQNFLQRFVHRTLATNSHATVVFDYRHNRRDPYSMLDSLSVQSKMSCSTRRSNSINMQTRVPMALVGRSSVSVVPSRYPGCWRTIRSTLQSGFLLNLASRCAFSPIECPMVRTSSFPADYTAFP